MREMAKTMAWVALVAAALVLTATPVRAQDGRWKSGGEGSCYWDANDSGPNQCDPNAPAGRYKLGGDGLCYWDAADSGPNQCDPPPPSALSPEDEARLTGLAYATTTIANAGAVGWSEAQWAANGWWVIYVYQYYGVGEAYNINVQDAYDAGLAWSQASGQPVAFRSSPLAMRLLKVQKSVCEAENRAKAGKLASLSRTLTLLAAANTAAAGMMATITLPTGPGALMAAAPFGVVAGALGLMSFAASQLSTAYANTNCIKGELRWQPRPMIRASADPFVDPFSRNFLLAPRRS